MKSIIQTKGIENPLRQQFKRQFFITTLFLILYLIVVTPQTKPVHAHHGTKNILVLHSYHEGYLWTDDITTGIKERLSHAPFPIDTRFEYMDTKRILDEAYIQQLVDLYRYKFRNTQFDVIIASDDNAFDFLHRFRDQLFPNTPVVYCGVNYITDKRAATLPNSTGINEAANLQGNVELILKTYPQVQHISIIADTTPTGLRISKQIDKLVNIYGKRVKINLLQNFTIDELIRKVGQLPANSVVLYTVFSRDRHGQFFEFDDSVNKIFKASSEPVFVTWDFSFGSGAIGGLLTSGMAQGEAAATLALQILKGSPADKIPYIRDSPNMYVFDYDALQRFDISEQLLPATSIIRNKPDDRNEQIQKILWKSLGAVILLICVIILLLTNLRQRKKTGRILTQANKELENRVQLRTEDLSRTNRELTNTNQQLVDSEEKYRSLSDAAFEGIVITHKGIILETNNTITILLGYQPSELTGRPVTAIIPKEEQEKVQAYIESEYEQVYETSLLRKDNSTFPVEINAKMYSYRGQNVRVTAIRDLTEKKKAEEKIKILQGVVPICMNCK